MHVLIFIKLISFLLLILVPFLAAIRDFRAADHSATRLTLGAFFYMCFCPLLSLLFLHLYPNLQSIFAIAYLPSLQLAILLALAAYWLSLFKMEAMPLWLNLLLPYGIAMGLLLALVMSIHFISGITFWNSLGHAYLVFPLYAPIPILLYGFRQFKRQNKYIVEQLDALAQAGNLSIEDQDAIHILQWKNPPQNIALLLLMMASLQVFLLPAGQPMNALLLAFVESHDFLFSMNAPWIQTLFYSS